jgi:hypothetical protein
MVLSKQEYRDLLPEELEALKVFADQYGKKWKEKLSMVYWYNARIFIDRNGFEYPELHRLRNELGPSWLAGFEFPKPKPKGPEVLKVLPAYELAVFGEQGNIVNARVSDKPVWSGKQAPPKIGAKVLVRINRIGEAKVRGYFAQDGYLGLLVSPSNPPEWYVKQNGKKADCHVYGAEIDAMEVA